MIWMKTVLLLGDITGRSRVALRMLSQVLEDRGHEVLMLPTALISNTLNLGRHEALDTTDYLLRSLNCWEALGMRYDLAYIGYITGLEQAKQLCAVADGLRAQGVSVVLDPILGDNGKRYNSVSDGQLEGMRLLCRHGPLPTLLLITRP
jgi:pyridoxine kinase